MIYVAWADGTLSTTQLQGIRDRLNELDGFDDDCRAAIKGWLDPDHPPSPPELQHLLSVVRRSGQQLQRSQKMSLAELGMGLVADIDSSDGWESIRNALLEIEEALGVAGVEESREMLAAGPPTSKAREPATRRFDGSALRVWLDQPNGDVRERLRRLLSQTGFEYSYGTPRSQSREQVLEWVRVLAEHGFGSLGYPKYVGGAGNFGAFLTAFETIAFHDMSLVIKFGVQYGLFGGSILFLGTRRHHDKYLRQVGTLALPGCFAMTELGHGSNVWDLETTADYDVGTESFVIDTPTETARKEWIGNAAAHGRMATVFAQLRVAGDSFGVHAFLVPIRDDEGEVVRGVRIEDCGEKEGLNGVDNGRLWFDHVRVPRENLLDRYAQVAADGTYDSSITSPSRRFFTMLGTLIGGRVSIAGASVSAAKSGLAIAVRYGEHRTQFGVAGLPERSILDYLTQQRRLMPRLATAYALHFACKYLVNRFLHRTEEDSRRIETLAAGIKSYTSWFAVDTLQACRESCGGQGYLAINRIPALKADADIFTTFEGDNTVLMQLVAKGLLTDFRHQFGALRPWGVVKFLAERAAAGAVKFNPVWTRLSDEEHLRDPDFHRTALQYREDRLLQSLARRMKGRIDDGMDSFDAFIECQDHAMSLANAFVERVTYEAFDDEIAECPVTDAKPYLHMLRDLFALSRFEADRGWFLESGYFEGSKSRAVRALVNRLCGDVREVAVALVDAFGIPEPLLGAPIARSIDPRSSDIPRRR